MDIEPKLDSKHTITHIEIPAPEFQKAIDFYSKVFRWTIDVQKENVYAFFRIGSTGTGGGLDATLRPAEKKSGPQVVIDVKNIEKMLIKIKKYGGKITQEKTEIPGNHSYYACFCDPNGNHLQLHTRT